MRLMKEIVQCYIYFHRKNTIIGINESETTMLYFPQLDKCIDEWQAENNGIIVYLESRSEDNVIHFTSMYDVFYIHMGACIENVNISNRQPYLNLKEMWDDQDFDIGIGDIYKSFKTDIEKYLEVNKTNPCVIFKHLLVFETVSFQDDFEVNFISKFDTSNILNELNKDNKKHINAYFSNYYNY